MQKSIPVGSNLASAIKHRRNELGLTIEAAAQKAGVGTKTWSRYEAGCSIRKDKYKYICKALNWQSLPSEHTDEDENLDLNEYKTHEAYSSSLAESFGPLAAVSFAIGSDILMDNLREDLDTLATMPRGTHIGELSMSFMQGLLPPQFQMQYDYDLLYRLRTQVARLRHMAHHGTPIIAHSVADELLMYLMTEESRILIENMEYPREEINEAWDEWAFDLFDDDDVLCLYSDMYLTEDHQYHINHWFKEQFYMDD